MIKFADCLNKNTVVGYIRIIIISIKREMAATENRIPDNINRITSWKSPINAYEKNIQNHEIKKNNSLKFCDCKTINILI